MEGGALGSPHWHLLWAPHAPDGIVAIRARDDRRRRTGTVSQFSPQGLQDILELELSEVAR